MEGIQYQIRMVEQGESPVCWFACALMLLQSKRRRTFSNEELGFLNGDPRLATIPNSSPNLELNLSPNNVNYSLLRSWGFRVRRINQVNVNIRRTPPELGRNSTEPQFMFWPANSVRVEHTVMYSLLINYGPFILFHRCGTIPYQPNRVLSASGGSAHAILITGIDLEEKICWFNNPWGDINVPVSLELVVGAIRNWESNSGEPSVAYLV